MDHPHCHRIQGGGHRHLREIKALCKYAILHTGELLEEGGGAELIYLCRGRAQLHSHQLEPTDHRQD